MPENNHAIQYGMFIMPFHDPAKPSIGVWFEATPADPTARPVPGDDAAAVDWFDPAAPPRLAFPTDAALLARLAAERRKRRGRRQAANRTKNSRAR